MADENPNGSPTVLTIAGFDPSGGAGIIADIRTLIQLGCRPTAAITSLTFQNSHGIFGAIHETAESLRAQILPIIEENRIAAVKIGMLPTVPLAREVARLIREKHLPAPVVDPVMQSSSGHRLMPDEAYEILVTELLPLSRLVTPNIPEAEKLAGINIDDEEDMRQAAARIRELGAPAVLIKGGHREQRSEVRGQRSEPGEADSYITASGSKRFNKAKSEKHARLDEGSATDLLDEDGKVEIFRGEWIDAPPVRGTGCMMSAAVAACFAKGMTLPQSVSAAKEFVAAEIQNAILKSQN